MSGASIFQNPKSGSIKVSGTCEIVDETGSVTETVTDPKFCGCGLSKDKPFCDKSHANYVSIVSTALENARRLSAPILPFGAWPVRGFEIRKRTLENRIAAGEKLVGVKYGVGLLNTKSEEKSYQGIFGFLTDAMQVHDSLDLNQFIKPGAEAEIAFKLSKDLSEEIAVEDVRGYVSDVAAGIEVYDSRYSEQAFMSDAVADNASSGAFAIGEWVEAKNVDFSNSTISIYEQGELKESVPASKIGGNPWSAVSRISTLIAAAGVILPAGSIIFSGSATSGLAMSPGEYRVDIEGVGSVAFSTFSGKSR